MKALDTEMRQHTDEDVAHALLVEADVAVVHGSLLVLARTFALPMPWMTHHCAGHARRSSRSVPPCVDCQAVCQPMKNTATLFPNGSRR